MKGTLILKLILFAIIVGLIAFCGGCTKVPKPDRKNAQPEPKAKESKAEEIKFIATPLHSEVHSPPGVRVSVTISDVLNAEKLGISSVDLLDYNIYLYAHPLNSDGWWRQNPVPAASQWTAQAFLGGIGQYSAKDGEKFQIIAVLSKQSPPEKIKQIQILKKIVSLHIISEVRTMTVRRSTPGQ